MNRLFGLALLGFCLVSTIGVAQDFAKPSPFQTNSDPAMGDWAGTWGDQKVFAQVNPLGGGKYSVNMLNAFDTRDPALAALNGSIAESVIGISGRRSGTIWSGMIYDGSFTGTTEGLIEAPFSLKKVERLSPTLGAKPPAGAIVLLDGKNLDAWMQSNADAKGKPIEWKLLESGAMEVTRGGIVSKHAFKDHKIHLEFRTPFMPDARGQGRGNSGIYLQGRYEVQILDSYSLKGEWNECGGIYGVAVQRVHMAAPPLQWQTYDIDFYAPRFDSDGKKTKDALINVTHNGVMIHENISIPEPTTAHIGGDIREAQGIHLQDHGNPIQYRNIWAVEIVD